MEFYRNKKKTIRLIAITAAILVVLIGLFLYSIGVFSPVIRTKLAAMSGGLGLVLAFVTIKMLISLTDSSPLLILSEEGIISKTTAVSKAAGLMLWEDIINISIEKVGGDTLIKLIIDKPTHYIPMIRKKLSSLVISGAEDGNGNLQVFLTASELDMEAPELYPVITNYRNDIMNTQNSKS